MQILFVLGIAVFLNIIANIYYTRIDLTSDKRYTLSGQTRKMLKELKDVVYVKVYLDGKDLRADLRKLNQNTREILDEFRSIAGNNIQYQFINPDDLPDAQTRKNLYKQLAEQGLAPIPVDESKDNGVATKLIIPGAIVSYHGIDMPVEIYKEGPSQSNTNQSLENAIISLEYQFVNAIYKLQRQEKPKVAILQGHGELLPIQMADVISTLQQYYTVDFVRLPNYKVGRLDPYSLVIVAKPDSTFTALEKYKLDQYIMNGGRVLWCLDMLHAEMDSLQSREQDFTYDLHLNLVEDFLFKYGVRVNYDIVQDVNANMIKLANRSGVGGKFTAFPWTFFPVVEPPANGHPIVNNIAPIWFRFVNSIDTLNPRQNPNIKKTILLQSSAGTRVPLNPVKINLSTAYTFQRDAKQGAYRQGRRTFAVLMEGAFNSVFKDRPPTPESLATGEYGKFKDKGKATKMIVISDGDVLRNDVDKSQGSPMPMMLGYDKYTNQLFGNKTFIMNCIDYLIEDNGLLNLRSKDIRIRPLDAVKSKTQQTYWQAVNLMLPILILIFFGIIFNIVRRRRYAR